MYIEENLRNKIIGEILKDEITKSGLTASDISRIIGRTRANVSQILNGRISINPRVINQIFAIVNKDFKIDYDFWGVMVPVFIYLSKTKLGKLTLTAIGLVFVALSFSNILLYLALSL